MLKFFKIYCIVFNVQMIVSYNCIVFYRIANLIEKAFEALIIHEYLIVWVQKKFVDFVCILGFKC